MSPRRYALLILAEGFCWLMAVAALSRLSLWGTLVGAGWLGWVVYVRERRRKARRLDEARP